MPGPRSPGSTLRGSGERAAGDWERRAGRERRIPVPLHRRQERDAGPLLADLAASARAKAAESAALQRRHPRPVRPADRRGRPGDGATASPAGGRLFTFGNGGSATDAATLASLFAHPPTGRALPAWSLAADQAMLTALGNDVGFDLVFARQIIAHAPRRTTSPSPCPPAETLPTCRPRWPRRRGRGLLTVGFAGYDGGAVGRVKPTSDVLLRGPLAERAPDPGKPGPARLRPLGGRASTCQPEESNDPRPGHPRATCVGAAARQEGRVIERIEAFRRRRPRLLDEVVTLAHGAGGKSSAALVDAVFLEAFRNPELERSATAPCSACPAGERLAIQHRLVRGAAAALPRRLDRAARRARHRQRPGGDRRRAAVAVGGIRARGGLARSPSCRRSSRDMAAAAAGAGVQIVTGDTKVVPEGRRRRAVHHHGRGGLIPAGRELSARSGARRETGSLLSGTMGDHGMAVMLARGDLALEADIRSDTAPVNGLVEDLLAAAPGTRWMRDPTRGGRGHRLQRARSGHRPGRRARRVAAAGGAGRNGAPASCSGSTRSTWPTKASSSPSSPRTRPRPRLAALRSHPLGRDAAVIGEIAAQPAGIVVMRTRSAAPASSTCSSATRCPGSADRHHPIRGEEQAMCLGIPGQVVDVHRPGRAPGEGRRQRSPAGHQRPAAGRRSRWRPGDWVLVHVGFAMAKIDEEEAAADAARHEADGPGLRRRA